MMLSHDTHWRLIGFSVPVGNFVDLSRLVKVYCVTQKEARASATLSGSNCGQIHTWEAESQVHNAMFCMIYSWSKDFFKKQVIEPSTRPWGLLFFKKFANDLKG